MNFNTANNTFRQLMSNGLTYRVPPFQRDYSWTADEWDDLWQDLVGLFGEEPEPAHYMGYLVLQSVDNKAFDLIDGQQRMTTLSLLMLAAVACLTEWANPGEADDPQTRRAQQLRGNYIGYLDPVSLVPRSKLSLNRHNDRFYQNYLVPLERLPQRGLNLSEHLLRRAFLWFKERIAAHAAGDGEAVARFIDAVVDKLFFTVITVNDELNAFKVFETLNARGVRLSATDLLKNHLFSVISRGGAHETELESLETRWEAIVGLLGSESFPEFLRVFWNSRNRLVRKVELFKTMRRTIGDKAAAFALIRDLDRQAGVYAALRNPEDELWNSGERDSLRRLALFNVRQPLAVLLTAFERFAETNRDDFSRFLRAVAVVSFRYNVICSRQSNEQEKVYNVIAQSVAAGERQRIADVIAALRPIYPEDEAFKTAFADKALRTANSRNKKIARHILFEIERRASGRAWESDGAKHTVEHVLPENPDEHWSTFTEQEQDRWIYRLGNLTLLDATVNRALGNRAFADKRAAYRRSGFHITQKLAEEYESWTPQALRARQAWMAKQACAIWRIDFPVDGPAADGNHSRP